MIDFVTAFIIPSTALAESCTITGELVAAALDFPVRGESGATTGDLVAAALDFPVRGALRLS